MKRILSLLLALTLLVPTLASSAELNYLYAYANAAAGTTDGTFTKSPAGTGTVAAIAGKKMRIVGYSVSGGSTATTLVFNSKSGSAGTAITSTKSFGGNGGFGAHGSQPGDFETKVGEAVTYTTGAGSTMGIDITYILQ
jgi:hypothetical protein